MPVAESLLSILVCPKCHQTLDYASDKGLLTCASCSLQYLVRDQIPIMLADEAQGCAGQD